MPKSATPTSIYLDRDLRLWLDMVATDSGRSRSQYVNRVLRRFRRSREERARAKASGESRR